MVDNRLIRFVKSLEKSFKQDNMVLYEEDRLEFFRRRRKFLEDNMYKFKGKDEDQ